MNQVKTREQKITAKVKYSTTDLPDGLVIGGEWPGTIVSWPDGKGRRATKPEHDLWRALEAANAEIARLKEAQ